ncbi:MAG TPA: hypothetical protein VFT32_01135, partial [Candidatus Eisenbacteria bacterium]|nr:hypothetical protein [Candidatus Eisenbacteria bacterium]
MAGRGPIPEGLLRRLLAACLLLAVAAGGVSCDLFEARKPNDPGLNFFPCAPLDQQDNVFSNVLLAYGRGDGLSCYLTTLQDTFKFVPDPLDVAETPYEYDNWTKTVEQRVTQNLISGKESFGLTYVGAFEL